MVDGQNFYENISLNGSNVTIMRSLARLMGGNGVVGKIIRSPRGQEDGKFDNMTVTGVVDDHVIWKCVRQSGTDTEDGVLCSCQPGKNTFICRITQHSAELTVIQANALSVGRTRIAVSS